MSTRAKTKVERQNSRSRCRRLVSASVSYTHLDVYKRQVVEGVETETGHRIVHALGADRAQGYFYGCPMDAQAFRERFLSAG